MRTVAQIAFLVVALAAVAQQSQTRQKSSSQVTATRTVHVFTDLEHELVTGLHSEDKATLDRLLAADFEVRDSSAPGEPVPRAQFIAQQHPADVKLTQMAVRLIGSVALVSFAASDGKSSSFIVDTWTQDASWKLVARYRSRGPTQPAAGDRHPTGRD